MSDVVFLLRLEHRNMSHLLTIVERQMQGLQSGVGIDHELMSSILGYFLTYPDECHHPKEDLIYKRLVTRDQTVANSIGDLQAHHAKLAKLTRELADALEKSDDGTAVEAEELGWLGWKFLETNRRHIALEEGEFFPKALAVLSERDWEDIDFEVFDREDPLFSEVTEKRFQSLRDQIVAEDFNTLGMAYS
ncbi:MAG: hemerythrin domain-containing protein [Rhodospirillales bacterium]|nr:hemerythrin domain-containing protein [Rhodospirillales bacterium]